MPAKAKRSSKKEDRSAPFTEVCACTNTRCGATYIPVLAEDGLLCNARGAEVVVVAKGENHPIPSTTTFRLLHARDEYFVYEVLD